MTAEEFIGLYEKAISSHGWAAVDPLIHPDACVTFSTGAVHKGKNAVRLAFEGNFSTIQHERYAISNLHWIIRTPEFAVSLFEFEWNGRINGRDASGAGNGTFVLVRNGTDWQLLAEHLVAAARGSNL